jgi:hypothetical protein
MQLMQHHTAPAHLIGSSLYRISSHSTGDHYDLELKLDDKKPAHLLFGRLIHEILQKRRWTVLLADP